MRNCYKFQPIDWCFYNPGRRILFGLLFKPVVLLYWINAHVALTKTSSSPLLSIISPGYVPVSVSSPGSSTKLNSDNVCNYSVRYCLFSLSVFNFSTMEWLLNVHHLHPDALSLLPCIHPPLFPIDTHWEVVLPLLRLNEVVQVLYSI